MKKVFLLFLMHAPAWGSVHIPVSDPIYAHLDKLIAAGLIQEYIYGQRPWSRHEIARLVREADSNRQSREVAPFIDEILANAKAEYLNESPTRLFDSASLSIDALDAEARVIPFNAAGYVDASVNPLTAYRDGRELVSGLNSYLDTRHNVRWGDLWLHAQPELRLVRPRDSAWDAEGTFRRLYAYYLPTENFEIEIGRDQLLWGQTENGGITMSNNARPLDMFRLGSPHPYRLPWLLSYLGPARTTLYVGNHGPNWGFPYAFFVGYRLSFRTFDSFEWNIGLNTSLGGQGAPTGPFHTYLVEGFLYGQTSEVNLSDHHISGDWRWRLGFLGNAEFYGEAQWEDTGVDSIKATFTYRMGIITGLYFPLLDSSGKWDLRVEVTKLPPLFYRNATFTSGYTLDRRILGNAWGSDSTSGRLVLGHHFSVNEKLSTSLEYASSHGDSYNRTADESEFYKTTHLPEETRLIFLSKLSRRLSPDLTTEFWAGLERVTNFNFQISRDRWHYLLGGSVTYRPQFDQKD